MEDYEHIRIIIQKSFTALKDVYNNQKEGYNHNPNGEQSRLIFPQYSKGETRLSEQELRFIFVEQFNKYCDDEKLNWFYSVETPTKYKYLFSENGTKIEPQRDDNNGKSAMVDLAIHNEKLERIALIEFKALNPDEECFVKDFVKLKEESASKNDIPKPLTFFVMYVKSHDKGTISSLKTKTSQKDSNTEFACFDLESGKQIEKIILE